MRHNKIAYFIGLSIILALLVLLFPLPAQAITKYISLQYDKGKIGDWIGINVYHPDVTKVVDIYFSSDEADVGDAIGDEVTAYQQVGQTRTLAISSFAFLAFFIVPDKLADGERKEDVRNGDYYVYATYHSSTSIVYKVEFTVLGGEIEVNPEEGVVGSEVEVSGEGLRPNQKISLEYDGGKVDIISGDSETDGKGYFLCTIVIPQSVAGDHTIAVSDESGDRAEATFSVKPEITLDLGEQGMGEVVMVSGTGFPENEAITLTIGGREISPLTAPLATDDLGSFSYSFVVPFFDSCGVRNVSADDSDGVRLADAPLVVLAGIALSPGGPSSPGYIGMKLAVRGIGFLANADVIVTYTINDEAIPVATAKADDNGRLSLTFAIPPSVAGSHVVTATDGVTSVTSIFTMESQAPPTPRLLLPVIGSTSPAEAYFDWEDVTDPSGVSYTLQVATDASFATILLEKKGLPQSEYAVSGGEKLAPVKADAPYYWRVKAVDGASNEGDWSLSGLFCVSFSWLATWGLYTFCGLGVLFLVLILVIIILWLRRRRAGLSKV